MRCRKHLMLRRVPGIAHNLYTVKTRSVMEMRQARRSRLIDVDGGARALPNCSQLTLLKNRLWFQRAASVTMQMRNDISLTSTSDGIIQHKKALTDHEHVPFMMRPLPIFLLERRLALHAL